MLVTTVVVERKAVFLGVAVSACLAVTMWLLSPTALNYEHGSIVALFLAFLSGLTTIFSP